MEKHYVKVIMNESFTLSSGGNGNTLFRNFISKVASFFLPKANPDFDELIENVKVWLLEFESETDPPVREIGLDSNGDILMIMPWRNNYGFWTDNQMSYLEFKKRFQTEDVSSVDFKMAWGNFQSTNENV
jgi:hypothetical protein